MKSIQARIDVINDKIKEIETSKKWKSLPGYRCRCHINCVIEEVREGRELVGYSIDVHNYFFEDKFGSDLWYTICPGESYEVDRAKLRTFLNSVEWFLSVYDAL